MTGIMFRLLSRELLASELRPRAEAERRFEEQAAVHGRRPGELRHPDRVVVAAIRLRGQRSPRQRRRKRHTALAFASLTGHLLVPPSGKLVPGRGLPRHTDAGVLRHVVRDGLLVAGIVGPLGDVARVPVVEDRGHRVFRVEVPGRREEPDLVALDRPAEHRVDVPRLDELVGLAKAQGPHLVVEVAALPLAGVVHEHRSAEAVASLPRDQIHLRAAGSRLAEAAGDLKGDLLRAADFRHVPDTPIPCQPALSPLICTWPSLRRPPCAWKTLNAFPETPPTSAPCALMPGISTVTAAYPRLLGIAAKVSLSIVRVACELCTSTTGDSPDHRDRLGQRTDAEVRVDRGHEGPFERDAITLESVEAAQRERDRVHAWTEIDDAVLTGAVSDDRSGLLDQRRTRRFDTTPGSTAPDVSLTTPVIVTLARVPRDQNTIDTNTASATPESASATAYGHPPIAARSDPSSRALTSSSPCRAQKPNVTLTRSNLGATIGSAAARRRRSSRSDVLMDSVAQMSEGPQPARNRDQLRSDQTDVRIRSSGCFVKNVKRCRLYTPGAGQSSRCRKTCRRSRGGSSDPPISQTRLRLSRVVVVRPIDDVRDVAILAACGLLDLDVGDPHHLRPR